MGATPDEPPQPHESGDSAPATSRAIVIQRRFERMLVSSRLLVIIPVVFLLIDAAGSFVYGCVIFVRTVPELGDVHERISKTIGRFLVVMDTYLVGATLMIAAFGFYGLFIANQRSNRNVLPGWLAMRDLEDLKARVVSMLILVAAITFVDVAVETTDPKSILWLGIGIALVIVALTAFLRFGRQAHARSTAATSSGQPDDALDH